MTTVLGITQDELNTTLDAFAGKYEVKGIPSLFVFKDGEKIAHHHSKFAKTPTQIREYLERSKYKKSLADSLPGFFRL